MEPLQLWLLLELCWKLRRNFWLEVLFLNCSQGFIVELRRCFYAGLHPMVISDAFQHAAEVSVNILKNMSQAVDLKDRASLIKIAKTSLNSKVTDIHLSGKLTA
jgi:TCP-1/cpn60 chaperonin family